MGKIEKENVGINDSEYWEKRFKDDWNDKKGPEQTAFFADLAFEYLPEWLLMDIRQNKMSVCDWGCAEGEAVSRLGQYLSPAQVYGVDVSETAIEHASKKFPNYKFKVENWLDSKHPDDEKVDVIFSSNTLEHFHDPMSILYSHLGNIARKYIIQMIPFEEPLDQMDKEHFYRFSMNNLPAYWDRWRCVFFHVIDTDILPGTRWGGKQALIVYGDKEWVETHSEILCLNMLSGQSDLLTKRLEMVKSQKEMTQQKLETEMAHSKILWQEKKQLGEEKKQLEDGIERLCKEKKLLERQNISLTEDIASLRLEHEKLEQINESLKFAVESVNVTAVNQSQEIEYLKSQQESLNNQYQSVQFSHEKLECQKNEIATLVHNAINKLEELKTRKCIKVAKLINYINWNIMKGSFKDRLKGIAALGKRSLTPTDSISSEHFLDNLNVYLKSIQYQCLSSSTPQWIEPLYEDSPSLPVKNKADLGTPLVSIVLPVYNHADLLNDSIESVLKQSYENWELIVINDGSTDDFSKVFEKYANHPKILLLDQENQTLPKALNNGFLFANGPYVTWTSADNLMHPRHIEAFVDYLQRHEDVDMAYSDYFAIDDQGKMLTATDFRPHNRRKKDSPEIHVPRDTSPLNEVPDNFIGASFMYRSSAMKIVGEYDHILGIEDYDYWMRMNSLLNIQHIGTDELLYYYRVHDNSLNARAKELKISDALSQLMSYEGQRAEFYNSPFNVVCSSKFLSLLPENKPNVSITEFNIGKKPQESATGKKLLLLSAKDIPLVESVYQDYDCICAWFGEDEQKLVYKYQYLISKYIHACFSPADTKTCERLNILHPTVIDCRWQNLPLSVMGFANNYIFFEQTRPLQDRLRIPPEIFNRTRAKKIMLQIDKYSYGGMEQVVVDMAEILAQRGLKIYICCCNPSEVEPMVQNDSIKLVYVNPKNSEDSYRAILHEHKIDIVNAHYSTFGAEICFQMGIPFIQTVHNMYVWLSEEQREIYRQKDAYTNAYICVSNNVAWYTNEKLQLPEKKTVVIPNGIDVDLFRFDTELRKKARAKLKFTDDDYVLLNMASVYAAKGQKHLIDGFAKALKSCPNLKLIIAGHISEPAYYEQMVERIDKLNLSDKIIHGKRFAEANELYQAADALVMPSFWEGCSLAIAEAVAMGLPVLSSRVGDVENQTNMDNCVIYDLPLDFLTDIDTTDLSELLYKKQKYLVEKIAGGISQLYHNHKRSVSDYNRKKVDRQFAYSKYEKLFDYISIGGKPESVRNWLCQFELNRIEGEK